VTGIGAPIPVEEEVARPDAVLVRAWLPFQNWNCGDAKRNLGKDRRHEDTLGTNPGGGGPIEREAGGEVGARGDFAAQLGLLGEEATYRQYDALVKSQRELGHSRSFAWGNTYAGTVGAHIRKVPSIEERG